jgi:hypothetical protein
MDIHQTRKKFDFVKNETGDIDVEDIEEQRKKREQQQYSPENQELVKNGDAVVSENMVIFYGFFLYCGVIFISHSFGQPGFACLIVPTEAGSFWLIPLSKWEQEKILSSGKIKDLLLLKDRKIAENLVRKVGDKIEDKLLHKEDIPVKILENLHPGTSEEQLRKMLDIGEGKRVVQDPLKIVKDKNKRKSPLTVNY